MASCMAIQKRREASHDWQWPAIHTIMLGQASVSHVCTFKGCQELVSIIKTEATTAM